MSTAAVLESADYRTALASIIEDTIAPAAAAVDRDGRYPRAALDALAAAGILGLHSSTEVGGGGGSLADVAEVVEKIAAACGSTAMVVLMHFAATTAIEAHGSRAVREATARGERLTSLANSARLIGVLQVKAVTAEAAIEVADGVMRLCGGVAFRKELGVERRFRDSMAARVMAPTTDALRDFVGRAALGLPLFDGA